MNVEFVDTNILVYAHDADAGAKQQRAIDLMARLATQGTGAISIQVLIEFYSAATRKLGMTSQEAADVIQDLVAWMAIHRPDAADILRATGLQRRHKISWFDALILNSALQLECSTVWTEDLNHAQRYGTVTAKNPFQ
jgi:predicted nucleic acid-binding protein